MSFHKKLGIVAAIIVSAVLISGCGLFGIGEKDQVDPPQTVSYTEDGDQVSEEMTGTESEELTGKEEAATGNLKTELYLINKDGYVVPQTLELPKKESVATQALEYLVVNGPVTEMLPNDFRAVIPADTKLSVDIKDKVATVNFSKEFEGYNAEDEKRILESITWTLTQFDSIEQVKLKLNGHELTEMPVNGTPIGEALSRVNGINMDTKEVVDITNTKPVTVYYLGGTEESYYYVPVTKRVSNKEENNITAAVNELVEGPNYSSNLVTDFLPGVQLMDEPKVENGQVTLNFNESVFSSLEEKKISQHLMDALVLSLTEQKDIESVAITVNGETEITNENGEQLAEPVTRPENVNTGSY